MYKLTDGTIPTEAVKKSFKQNSTVAYITYDNQKISYDTFLTSVDMNEERYVPDEGFIGQAVAREIEIKVDNKDNYFDLENKEVEYYQGAIQNDGSKKYINFGKFIVLKPDSNDTKETLTFTARDYMQKFNIKYVHKLGSNYTYLQLVQSLCKQAGVELGSTSFRNSSKIIKDNPFINGEQCRFILKQVAKIAFSVAYIGQDNKLYIGFDNKTTVDEEITTDNYIELSPNEQTKPITVITLRSSEVPDSKYSIKADKTLIDAYGENELIIEEDYFSYTDELRKDLIQAAKALFGLTYSPVQIDLLGSVYLGFNDVIQITNSKGGKLKTFCLNLTSKYNGTLYNTVESPALTDIEQKYEYEEEQDVSIRKTYVNIDKANQVITAAVEKIDKNTEEISAIKIKTGEIELSVSKKVDSDKVVSTINLSKDKISLKSNRIEIESTYTKLTDKGVFTTTSGSIAGIAFNENGLYYSGSSKNDGFGLWKTGVHNIENTCVIFHAGGNNTNIGGALFRVYQNGTVYASQLNIASNRTDGTGIHIQGAVPFLDFKAGNSANYTSRIIDYGDQLIIASNADLTIANRDNTLWRGVRCNRVYLDSVDTVIFEDEGAILLGADQGISCVNGSNTAFTSMNASEYKFLGSTIILRANGSSRYIASRANGGFRSVSEDGDSFTEMRASEFAKQSSRRYKENIKSLSEDEANKLLDLEVVTFDYKKDSMMKGKSVAGLIAENTYKILPNTVTMANIDNEIVPDAIDYSNFVPYLIKQVQMLNTEIDKLKNKIEKLTR